MFVKKDLRKIPQILSDAASRAVASPPNNNNNNNENSKTTEKNDKNNSSNDDDIITEVRFARRAPEFLPSCSVSLLLEPRYRPALDNLVQLSLYDCGLQTLTGMELQSSSSDNGSGGGNGGGSGSGGIAPPLFPKLTSLDIGRNPKLINETLPNTFHTQFPQLLQLWSDDCGFGPDIPPSLLEMDRLEVVRMTGNRLEGKLEGGIGIRYWKSVKVLAFDGNKLSSVGSGIGKLKYLEKLHLRGNKLVALPEGVPSGDNSNLTTIGLSSNQLTSLPVSLLDVAATLKELYLNGNQIEQLPEGVAEKLVELTKLNLAHNSIGKDEKDTTTAAGSQSSQGSTNDGDVAMEDAEDDGTQPPPLPQDFVDRFGMPEPLTGMCTKDECVVRMEGNPMAESIRRKHLEEEERKAKEMAMETDAELTEAIQ